MFTLLFQIFKILGALLLLVILCALLIAVLIIIIPIKFNVKIEYIENFKIKFDFKILFKIIRCTYHNFNESEDFLFTVKIFGINPMKLAKIFHIKKRPKEKHFRKEDDKNYIEKNKKAKESENIDGKPKDNFENEKKSDENFKKQKHLSIEPKRKTKNNAKRTKKQKKKKLKLDIDFAKLKKEIKKLLKRLKKNTKRLTKSIKIKKLKIRAEYGFEDPFFTGTTLGFINIILPILNHDINITPNFQESMKNLELESELKISLARLIFCALSFAFCALAFIIKKPIRQFIFYKGDFKDE